MPDNVYDYHEHLDHNAVTHQHDNHPRHRHDNLGSVIYLDNVARTIDVGYVHVLNDNRTCVDNCPHPEHTPIGSGGYGYSYRTR